MQNTSRSRGWRVAAAAAAVVLLGACGGRPASSAAATSTLPARCGDAAEGVGVAGKARPPRQHPSWLSAYDDATRPARLLDVAGVDLVQTIRQLRTFKPRDRFTLPSSGVVAVIHSDGDVVASPAALDELLHAHLRHFDQHADPVLRARLACYARAILDDREFAGTTVNIYVPSTPRACVRNLRLVRRARGPWATSCDWSGATPPVVFKSFLGEIRSKSFHLLVAPGVSPNPRSTSADHARRVAEVLRHEADHLWDWMMGQSFDFVANEQRAQAGDALVQRRYRSEGLPWPVAFRYPQPR